jgi:hypothetical protein
MEQDEFLRFVVEVLEGLGITYLVTGSVATIFYGEPRFTNDIDIVAEIREEHVDRLVDAFPPEDFYLSPESARNAVEQARQFNVIHPKSGLKVDFMVPVMDAFDLSRFKRARRVSPAADYTASFASPEDVILKKLVYFREGGSDKHLRDCAAVLEISQIDRSYIDSWAGRLGVESIWRQVLEIVDRTQG